jgi:hypothetical protein
MAKASQVQTSRPLTQAERLARTEYLKNDVSKLERQIRDLQEQIARLLDACEHTDGSGRTSVIGGRTKVCTYCGRVVASKNEKLWG